MTGGVTWSGEEIPDPATESRDHARASQRVAHYADAWQCPRAVDRHTAILRISDLEQPDTFRHVLDDFPLDACEVVAGRNHLNRQVGRDGDVSVGNVGKVLST